jgi:hypothetical protein
MEAPRRRVRNIKLLATAFIAMFAMAGIVGTTATIPAAQAVTVSSSCNGVGWQGTC